MPVPQTFTSGALGLATKWSASSMHTFKFPWPAPSPRTAWPSMYAFWLISSLFFTKAPDAPRGREARNRAEFMSEYALSNKAMLWLGQTKAVEQICLS